MVSILSSMSKRWGEWLTEEYYDKAKELRKLVDANGKYYVRTNNGGVLDKFPKLKGSLTSLMMTG